MVAREHRYRDQDVEDFAQDFFLRLVRHLASHPDRPIAGETGGKYLFIHARQLAHQKLVRGKRDYQIPPDKLISFEVLKAVEREPATDDATEAIDRRLDIAAELATLPEHLRDTLLAYYRDSEKGAEIGRRLGVSRDLARQRRNKALALLRDRPPVVSLGPSLDSTDRKPHRPEPTEP